MRLFADENIQDLTIAFLRDLGHDVQDVRGVGMRSALDGEVYAYAQANKRALLTFNGGFADVRELERGEHYGVIRMRVKSQRIHNLHPILQSALSQLEGFDLENTLVPISDQRTRIRSMHQG